MVIEPVEGVVFDPDARRVWLCGTEMVVGSLMRTEADPGGSIVAEEDYPPEWVPMMRSLGVIGRTRKKLDESVHFTAMCGENGWWLEMSVFFGDDETPAGLVADLPNQPLGPDVSARQALARWVDTCNRVDPPPRTDGDEPGPFCGMAPGTWLWD